MIATPENPDFFFGWDDGADGDEFWTHFDPMWGPLDGRIVGGARWHGNVIYLGDAVDADFGSAFPQSSGTSALYFALGHTVQSEVRFDFFVAKDIRFDLRIRDDFDIQCFDVKGATVVNRRVPGSHYSGGVTLYPNGGAPRPVPLQQIALDAKGVRRCLLTGRGGILDDFRYRVDRNDLELSCVGDLGENRVTRGQELTCTAKGSAASDSIEIETWKFTGTDSRGQPYMYPEDGDGPVTDSPWRGKMVVSGKIKVRATINGGQPKEKEVHISVVARSWEGEPVDSEVTKISFTEFPARRRPPAYPDSVQDLGRAHLTWETLPLSADVAEQISDFGPNHYLIYFKRVPIKLTAQILVHPELEERGTFWRQQASRQPEYSQQPVCVQGQFDRYVQLILAHEGYPPTPQSHSGVFISEVRRLAGPAVEGLVFPDLARAELNGEVFSRLETVAHQAYTAADEPVDRYHAVPFGCKFNFEQR